MSGSKHRTSEPKDRPPDNPQIHGGRGTFARRATPEDLAGETTVEGDVENDTTPSGGVDPDQVGRKGR